MRFGVDQKGQNYLEWDRGYGALARAWISHREGEKDWAGTKRYLNAARIEQPGGGPRGQGVDFPVTSDLGDHDILRSFVVMASALTGNALLTDPK